MDHTIVDQPTTSDRDCATSDLGVAAFLFALGYGLPSIKPDLADPGRHLFVFRQTIPRDVFLAFHNADATTAMPAKRVVDAVREMKLLLRKGGRM